MKYLNRPKWNIIAIIIFTIISLVIMMTTDFVEKEAGMATIIIMWIPLFFGLATLVVYGISRLITKKYNWIITVAGILFTLTTSIQYHYFA